jgi:membrane fusion protein (multidrug efflux system)
MSAEQANESKTKPSRYKRGMTALTAVLLLTFVAGAAYWWFDARYYETTDDAYVAGDVIPVSSELAGTISEVGVNEGDRVAAGMKLVAIDNAPSRLKLERAEADLAKAVRQISQLVISDGQFQASLALRQVELSRAEDRLQRRTVLDRAGMISPEEMRTTRSAVEEAKASLRVDAEKLRSYRALAGSTTVPMHPEVVAAATRVREAYLDLARTELVSPVNGFVLRKSVQIGQRVSEGGVLLSLVQLDALWVEANFKEDQLRFLRIGQPVQLVSDLYGNDVRYAGTVTAIGAATGAALSPVPSRNSLGNWVKVVQRVPVRIAVNADDLRKHPLRLGLSMQAVVDIRNTSGPVLKEAPSTPSANGNTMAHEKAMESAGVLIRRIVDERGTRASVPAIKDDVVVAAPGS